MSTEKGLPKTAVAAIGLVGLIVAAIMATIVIEYVCLVNDASAWAPSVLTAPLADAATNAYYAIGGYITNVLGVLARLHPDLFFRAIANVLRRVWQFVPARSISKGMFDESRTYARDDFEASVVIVGVSLSFIIAYIGTKICMACLAIGRDGKPYAPTAAADPEPAPHRPGPVTRSQRK